MKIVVDISDCRVSHDTQDTLITYSLGSCIAVTMYDAALRLGGMLHFQLPSAKMDLEKSRLKPYMFADSGLEALTQRLRQLGAATRTLKVKIAGGAQVMNDANFFNIGKRNYAAIRQWLWKNGLFIDAEDIGGQQPRNMTLAIDSGIVTIKSRGVTRQL